VQAIQEAVCQQRYNYQLWMALSRVCVILSNMLRSNQDLKTDKYSCEMYLKEPSVDIVKKSVVLVRPHFKLRHSNKVEINCNATNTTPSVTGDDISWIIDVLGAAVTNGDNQSCIVRLADHQTFHHFLMVLSCASCLWAKYV